MSHSAEIIRHYVAKNLPWNDFMAALKRHAQLLMPLDRSAATALLETPLTAYRAPERPKR